VLPVLNILLEDRAGGALTTLLRPVSDELAKSLRKFQDRDTRELLIAERRTVDFLDELMADHGRLSEEWNASNVELQRVATPGALKETQMLAQAQNLCDGIHERRRTLPYLRLARRPLMLATGLNSQLLKQWKTRAFDRFITILRPHGGGLDDFVGLRAADRREVVRLIQATVAGDDLALFDGLPCAGVGMNALWAIPPDDLLAIHRDPLLGRPENLANFLIVDLDCESDAQAPTPEAQRQWTGHLVARLLPRRLSRKGFHYVLEAQAIEEYDDFRTRASEQAGKEAGCISAHLRQLAGLSLRLALGYHLVMGMGEEREIALETYLRGRDLATKVSAAHVRNLRLLQDRIYHQDLEAHMEVVVTKVRIKGPMTKRGIARSFHDQDYDRHIPAIEEALDRGLLQLSEDNRLELSFEPSSSARQRSSK
jgi:hypothetical protein